MFHGHLNYFQRPPLGGRPNKKPGDHGTLNAHNCWFIMFYCVWGPAWMEIHWDSNWLRARSHMTSHYTWGSVTTLHDLGGVLGRPLDTFFWGLTISWSWLLACVWSGPKRIDHIRPTHIVLNEDLSTMCYHGSIEVSSKAPCPHPKSLDMFESVFLVKTKSKEQRHPRPLWKGDTRTSGGEDEDNWKEQQSIIGPIVAFQESHESTSKHG